MMPKPTGQSLVNGASLSRRRWLDWFLGTSLGALAASVLYPIVRYIIPPDRPEAQTNSASAGHEGELKVNEAKIFAFGNQPGILIRTADGYKAFSATCTHLHCTVQFRADLQQIWCACHNGFYDLSGRNVAGPPPRPLEEYAVHVSNGDIVVSKG
jgi:cytochrome b6-f complex iron-sulfur subunit